MYPFLKRIKFYFQGYNPEVFISYAWNDINTASEDIESIVDELSKALALDGFKVIRDKSDVKYKEQFTNLTQRIGSGEFIVVVISDKYLRSENCMSEFLEIYRCANSKVALLKEKIFPVILDGAKIYTPLQRLEYSKHWQDEINKLKAILIPHLPWKTSTAQNSLRLYEDISSHIDIFTHLLSDMNTLNVKLLSQNSFQEVKRAITQRTLQKSNYIRKRKRKRISITISMMLSVTALITISPHLRKMVIVKEPKLVIRDKDAGDSSLTSSESLVLSPPIISNSPPQPPFIPKYLDVHGLVTDNETGYSLDSVVVFINDIKCLTQDGVYSVKILLPQGLKKEGEMIFACKYYKTGYIEHVNNISYSIQDSNLRLGEVRLNHLNQIP